MRGTGDPSASTSCDAVIEFIQGHPMRRPGRIAAFPCGNLTDSNGPSSIPYRDREFIRPNYNDSDQVDSRLIPAPILSVGRHGFKAHRGRSRIADLREQGVGRLRADSTDPICRVGKISLDFFRGFFRQKNPVGKTTNDLGA